MSEQPDVEISMKGASKKYVLTGSLENILNRTQDVRKLKKEVLRVGRDDQYTRYGLSYFPFRTPDKLEFNTEKKQITGSAKFDDTSAHWLRTLKKWEKKGWKVKVNVTKDPDWYTSL